MIEPTDEMVRALRNAKNDTGCGYCDDCLGEQVTAVLAIVERDHCLEPRGHVYHPLARGRVVSDPCLCGADLGPPWDSTPHQKGTRGCRGAS